ncbi:AIM24 family protein, partial [Streptomyces nigra]
FVGAGTVLLQSSETLMAEQATGVLPPDAGVPGSGGAHTGPSQAGGAPRLPGQLGDLQRRFGL